MADHGQWVGLDRIINSYIDESEQSSNKYYKLFQIAFRGMEQLGIDFFYRIRSVKLPINSNKTVSLPADMIQYTKIGVLNSYGEIIPLAFNSKLTYYGDLLADRQSKTVDNTLFDYYNANSPIFFNYWANDGFVNLYGLPSGTPFVGSFNIDINNNILLLSQEFIYSYVIIEYMSAPEENGDYFIPIQFKEALLAYIAWRDIANLPTTRRGAISDKRDRRHEFYNERRLANARYRPYYLEQAYEMNLKDQRLTIKV